MATYFHGGPEIHPEGLQTLYLMNPGYAGYSDTGGAPGGSMVLLDSGMNSLNPVELSHSSPPSHHQSQHLVGIPLPQTPESSSQYNLWNQRPASNSIGRAAQQVLSLSLSSQQPAPYGYGREGVVPVAMPELAPVMDDEGLKLLGSSAPAGASGLHSVLMNSKYLKAAQEVLEEVVSVGKGFAREPSKKDGMKGFMVDAKVEGESSGKREVELTIADRQELQMKKAKLLNMLDEVEQRYKQYHRQMQIVVSSFEAAAGPGSAKTYTALALQTISKQFRCLREAIAGQIKVTGKSLGEEDCFAGGGKSIGSRLRLVDHHLRQQRALQQLGMMQHNAWRPQRGLPERAVSILRAWLFEHFLHPYPKDSDKIMLAKQTGLTRSQVSNWFINARVRLWKPMVEEMYKEEMKELGQDKPGEKSNTSDFNEESASKASTQPKTEQASSLASKEDNPINPQPPPAPSKKYGIAQTQDDESMAQPLGKKARNNDSLHLNAMQHSLTSHMKPENISNRELLMKFMEARCNGDDGHNMIPTIGNHGGGFGGYSIGEISRFDPQHFASSFHGNGVL
ncbi:hypothetical protein HPP92_003979 [Vanilla planifolia]|uniref:Homeobox domain-containing protein n=1 Tax=Vanilla planifolia TaxID=51239 RepID=A0A835SGN0_VANPL|nr:hypothetical protein HPP92_003979 [Vanilla planifolia]